MSGRPFEPGNKMGRGRPPGSRNKKTVYQELLESHAPAIIKKAQLMAVSGDPTALRLCIERLIPVAKPPVNRFRLPPVGTVPELEKALPAVMQVVSRGQLSAQEGESFARMIDTQRRTVVDREYGERIDILEQKDKKV